MMAQKNKLTIYYCYTDPLIHCSKTNKKQTNIFIRWGTAEHYTKIVVDGPKASCIQIIKLWNTNNGKELWNWL